MAQQISIEVAEDGADDERTDLVTSHLREALKEVDIEDIVRMPGGPPPPNTRGLDIAAIGALLVTVAGIGTSLNDIITVVRGWLTAGRAGRIVKITIDGDTLELTDATLADQERLVALFTEKHGG